MVISIQCYKGWGYKGFEKVDKLVKVKGVRDYGLRITIISVKGYELYGLGVICVSSCG